MNHALIFQYARANVVCDSEVPRQPQENRKGRDGTRRREHDTISDAELNRSIYHAFMHLEHLEHLECRMQPHSRSCRRHRISIQLLQLGQGPAYILTIICLSRQGTAAEAQSLQTWKVSERLEYIERINGVVIQPQFFEPLEAPTTLQALDLV